MRQIFLGDGIMPQIFQWNIDSSLGVIHGDVLPEVGQLQCRAGVVGELLSFGVAITAQVEDEMAYGICRIAAIEMCIRDRRSGTEKSLPRRGGCEPVDSGTDHRKLSGQGKREAGRSARGVQESSSEAWRPPSKLMAE